MLPRWLVLLVLMAGGACTPAPQPVVILATTTSVANSGLLDVITSEYSKDHRVVLRAHLVGSGRALAMLGDGSADVVISHAPDAETEALAQHSQWVYSKLMFNYFVIVGPNADVAHVKEASTAEDAFRRIAGSGVRFISRGDSSGTHERERLLWRLAGTAPPSGKLVIAGQGMGTTLRIADQTMAYTLTDRATFAQNASSIALRVLFEGGASLLNTYAVIYEPQSSDARTFAEWLRVGKGRDVIDAYRVGGVAVFTAWPRSRPGNSPAALPR